jgi:type I site-specific restriction-modification system R (restriction) subunit
MLNESIVEDAALEWFGEMGYSCLGAEALTPALSQGERESYSEVVLVGRLREAIRRLNFSIPEEAREEALRKVLRVGTPSLTQTNRAFHKMLRDGVDVGYARGDGSIKGDKVLLVDFTDVRASGMAEEGVVREGTGTYWAGRQRGGKPGDRRAGVVWHTQGSGKSFSMLFFAARVVRHPAMQNPTLVVLTDRNDLDDQLFGQFQRCADILGQTPIQAADRTHLRELLNRASGGVIFTTLQKFAPLEPSPRPSPTGRGSEEHYRGGFDFQGSKNGRGRCGRSRRLRRICSGSCYGIGN